MSALFSYFYWCDLCLIWCLLGQLSPRTAISKQKVKKSEEERVLLDHRTRNGSESFSNVKGNVKTCLALQLRLNLNKNVNTVHASEYYFSLETVLLNRTEVIET